MKKFYCVIPYQQSQLEELRYEPVGNEKLRLDGMISFPILTAIGGYVAPGEAFKVVAAKRMSPLGEKYHRQFLDQLEGVCTARGLLMPQVDIVEMPEGEGVAEQAATFQKLIARAEDNDELFACFTYGAKPVSQALLMAVQYAYRVKKNASITCVVYGEAEWSKRRSKEEKPPAWVYDMTALLQLDEVVRLLADRKVADPKRAIDAILGQ